jgi:hypothetical protein
MYGRELVSPGNSTYIVYLTFLINQSTAHIENVIISSWRHVALCGSILFTSRYFYNCIMYTVYLLLFYSCYFVVESFSASLSNAVNARPQ